ncbi:unnamed protein product [Periconia digitata]|uniref:AMP-activated protein kinase glycogen-binding domain-containing protein n=1 Tax=Periconia digitata TaxID=1303443 RepID=A0A9W4UKH7_9PLEO|nr:unnamed protein product [Periconia digitata]
MVTRASITFEHPKTDSPVYVVTEMSSPPWEPLEMKDSGRKTDAGDIIFVRDFEDVDEGNHQYKIRIGEGNWVLDSSKDIASDGAGHLNNLVRAATVKYSHDSSSVDVPSAQQEVGKKKERVDSTQIHPDVPFLADKVRDRKWGGYGGTVSGKLLVDKSTREADSDQVYHDDEEVGELDRAPTMAHEQFYTTEVFFDDDEDINELDRAPTMSHEQTYPPEEFEDDEEINELDRAPTMSHEQTHAYQDSDDYDYDGFSELDRAPSFSHETAPRLPQESTEVKKTSVDFTDTDNAKSLFGGTSGSFFLRRRGTESSLPHALAPSDAEDVNLRDPSLEPFPIESERILHRINTISTHLPEDQPEGAHADINSPDALSQACSSVDLGPVRSHTSLMAIPESDAQEEEDEEEDSLPSPVLKTKFSGDGAGSRGSNSDNPASSSDNDTTAVPTPAQRLESAREAFSAKGKSKMHEPIAEDPTSHAYWKEHSYNVASTSSEGTESSSSNENSDDQQQDHDQDRENQEEEVENQPASQSPRRPASLWGRLLAPVRVLFARCLGRKPEDVSHTACALLGSGILAVAIWWFVSTGTIYLPIPDVLAPWMSSEWVGSGLAFVVSFCALLWG